jgi:hypothetical protein
MRQTIKFVAASFAAVVLVLTTAGAGSPSAGSDWIHGDDRAEVRQLGHADAANLQQQVDEQVHRYGGTQVSANEVSYRGGTVILALPLPGQRTAPVSSHAALAASGGGVTPDVGIYYIHGCTAGGADNRWYCFYQDAYWGGRRLQWNLPHCNVQRNDYIDFSVYGFESKISSWVNTGALNIWAFDHFWNQLWYEAPANPPSDYHDNESSYVGNPANDTAYYAEAC